MNRTIAPRKARVLAKADFLKADDPAQALLEYFRSMNPKLVTGHQRAGVRRPLILISQLPRSGGSLLSQLLDGHPELLVYPWEMKIGYPSKGKWPTLDLNATPQPSVCYSIPRRARFFCAQGLPQGTAKARALSSA
jgi:hypothetical protein